MNGGSQKGSAGVQGRRAIFILMIGVHPSIHSTGARSHVPHRPRNCDGHRRYCRSIRSWIRRSSPPRLRLLQPSSRHGRPRPSPSHAWVPSRVPSPPRLDHAPWLTARHDGRRRQGNTAFMRVASKGAALLFVSHTPRRQVSSLDGHILQRDPPALTLGLPPRYVHMRIVRSYLNATRAMRGR